MRQKLSIKSRLTKFVSTIDGDCHFLYKAEKDIENIFK